MKMNWAKDKGGSLNTKLSFLLTIVCALSILLIIPACKKRSAKSNDKNSEETKEIERKRNEDELIKYVKAGDAEAVKQMLGSDVSPILSGQNSFKPLEIAALIKRKDIVEYLIRAGADVNAKNDNDESILHRTVGILNFDIAKLLVDSGADVNAKDTVGTTPLMEGVFEYEMTKMLIERGADVNARNNNGQTALIVGSIARSPRIIKLLLAHGADVNAQDNRGETALEGAYLSGCLEVVKVLMKAGAKD